MGQPAAMKSVSGTSEVRGGVTWQTLGAFVTVTVLLGMNFVAVRFSNQELMPFWGAGLRFTVAGLILFGILRLRGLKLPRGGALTAAIVFGVLVFGMSYALMYWALLTVPSGMAVVVFATMPLMTLLLAASVGQERFSLRGLTGAALGVAGLALAFSAQLRANVPLAGLAAVLIAAALGALATVLLKRFPKSHPLSTNAVAMAVGAALLLLMSQVARERWMLPSLSSTWIALSYLLVSTIAAFVLMVWILGRWSASATTYSFVLQPLVTVIGASVLAGEQVTPLFLGGGALVILGVYVGALGNEAKPQTAPASNEQAA